MVRILLEATERRHMVKLALAFVVVGIVETAGVASIGPFMAVLVDPQGARDGKVLGVLYRMIEPSSNQEFVIAVGVFVLAFILVANALSALVLWQSSRFVFGQQHRIAQRLLDHYLRQPYAAFLQRNTSDLVKSLFLTNNQVVAGMLMPAVQSFGRAVVVVLVVVLLAVLDPVLSLSVGVAVGGAYVLIYTNARKYLSKIGRVLTEADKERAKIAGEALNGLREVRMYGAEERYKSRFALPSERYAKAQTASEMVATLPRNALEVVAFGFLLGVTIYLFEKHGNEVRQALPMVALYGFAAYRLMGAVQIVFNGLARIRFNSAALDILVDEFRRSAITLPAAAEGDTLHMRERIEARRVEFGYDTDKRVLNGVSLTIAAGTTVGIVGPSGSGKSTFVDLLLGFLEPDDGEIVVDGTPISATNAHRWRANIGYVSQQTFLLDGTIAENIAFGLAADQIDMEAVREAARCAHIHEFVEELGEGYQTVVGERGARLSGGQRQRIAIARALYRTPPVIVLDEATNALDNVTEARVSEAVHELRGSKTVIMIAHRLKTIRECDRILVFSEGGIVGDGTYSELMASCEAFRLLTRAAESTGVM